VAPITRTRRHANSLLSVENLRGVRITRRSTSRSGASHRWCVRGELSSLLGAHQIGQNRARRRTLRRFRERENRAAGHVSPDEVVIVKKTTGLHGLELVHPCRLDAAHLGVRSKAHAGSHWSLEERPHEILGPQRRSRRLIDPRVPSIRSLGISNVRSSGDSVERFDEEPRPAKASAELRALLGNDRG